MSTTMGAEVGGGGEGRTLMATQYFLEIISFSLGNKISVTALTFF